MKNSRLLIALMAVTVALSACGKKKEDNKEPEKTEATKPVNKDIVFYTGSDKELIIGGETFCLDYAEGVANYKDIPGAVYVTNEALQSRNVDVLNSVKDGSGIKREEASVVFNFPCEGQTGAGTYNVSGEKIVDFKSFAVQADFVIDGLTPSSDVADAENANYIIDKKGNAYFTFYNDVDGNTDFESLKNDLYSAKSLADLWNLEYGNEAKKIICSNEMIAMYDYLSIPEIIEEVNGNGINGESLLLYNLALAKNVHDLNEGNIKSFAYKKLFITNAGTNYMYITLFADEDTVNRWFDGIYY